MIRTFTLTLHKIVFHRNSDDSLHLHTKSYNNTTAISHRISTLNVLSLHICTRITFLHISKTVS